MKKQLVGRANHTHQFKSYFIPSLKGFIYSGIITIVFFLFLWGVQSSLFSLMPLKLKPLSSSYTQDMLYSGSGIEAKQDVAFSFTLNDKPYNAILFNPLFSSQVSIKMNDELIQAFPETANIDNFGENMFILKSSDLITANTNHINLILHIEKGGALKLDSPIIAGRFQHLKFLMLLYKLTKDQIYFIVTGLGILLAFVMLTIAFEEREKRLMYLLFGTYAFYFAIVYPVAFAFRTEAALTSAVYLSRYPTFDFIFSIFLVAGIELYLSNKLKLTRFYILGTVIIAVLALFFGPEFFKVSVEMQSLFFYIAICLLSKNTFFNFIIWTNIIQELHDSWLIGFYPYLKYSTFGITSCIILLGLGTFFINDYKKQNKDLKAKTTELLAANEEMYAMNEELESSYQEIESINAELEERAEQRTQQLQNRNQSLRTLLDNTGEGFCKFSCNFLIEPEYSAECEILFNTTNMAYASFPHLLYPDDQGQREFIQSVLEKAFEEQDQIRKPVFLSLLPGQVQIGSRMIEMTYKSVFEENTDKIMMIARDCTEAMRLKQEISRERMMFEKIFKIVTDYQGFNELKTDYKHFFEKGIYRLLDSSIIDFPQKKTEIYRVTHTFKGNFAGYDLHTLVERLHQAEIAFREPYSDETAFRNKIKTFDFSNWLEEEMDQIYKTIDKEYFEIAKKETNETTFIHSITELVQKMPDCAQKNKLLELVKDYRKKALKKLLKPLKNLALTTAARLGKPLKAIQIDGDNVRVDPDRFKPLIKNCIHILRNAIDHGIESVDERIKKDKPHNALLLIHIRRKKAGVEITFSDDGKGFDREKISEKALSKGIINEADAKMMDDQAIYELTFSEGFSTKQELTDISGFGTGLAAVEKSVQALNGTLTIQSEKDFGTKIIVYIPLIEPKALLQKQREDNDSHTNKF